MEGCGDAGDVNTSGMLLSGERLGYPIKGSTYKLYSPKGYGRPRLSKAGVRSCLGHEACCCPCYHAHRSCRCHWNLHCSEVPLRLQVDWVQIESRDQMC